jgi:3-phosphoshikimate 1-carboxyvinyltransferase
MGDMPDASLMLMAIAPLLYYPVMIRGLSSLRVKETDRIAAMARELKKLGVRVGVGKDWIKVWPVVRDSSASFFFAPPHYHSSFEVTAVGMTKRGGMTKINTYDDHRIAMSFAILGTRLGNLEIQDPDCVQKTYPNFWRDLRRLS